MDSALPAITVSLVLLSAVVLGLANPRRAQRRMAVRLLRDSPDRKGPPGAAYKSNGPPGALHRGRIPEAARNSPGSEGLLNVPMILELVAAMLGSGAGLGRSLELIASCAPPQLSGSLRGVVAALDIGTDWETAWRSAGQPCAEARALKDALAFAALTGAPSAAILYAQAARLRRERFRAAEKRAAALGVKLVVPLGLCSLPAFICFGVVPVLLAMLPSAG